MIVRTLVALLALLVTLPAAAAWRSEPVFGGGSSSFSSVVADPGGEPAIAHGVDGLSLARWNGSAWVDEDVDPSLCVDDVSLAWDAGGHPAIAYHSFESAELRFARHDGTRWRIETVATQGGIECSLAFDGGGEPVIAYGTYPTWSLNRGAEGLAIARHRPSGWSSEAIEAGVYPSRPILRFDPSGRPAVAYVVQGGIRFARHDGASWSIAAVPPVPFGAPVADIGFAFNPAGTAVLACATGDVWYGSADGSIPWQVIDLNGIELDLELDPGGAPTVAYETTSRGVRVAHPGGPWGWTPEDVAASGRLADVALAPSGEAFLSFRDEAALPGRLVSARDGGGWRTATVVSDGPAFASFSFALSPAGVPSVAVHDEAAGALLFGRRTGGAWSFETAIVGPYAYSALSYDRAGLPAVVARPSGASPELVLARHDGTGWTREPLGRDLMIGRRALAFDEAGEPAVTGIDGSSRLVLLRRSGGVWNEEVAAAPVTSASGLRFDPAGAPAIAFTYDGKLWLAHKGSSGWVVEEVYAPASRGVSGDVDLEIDPAGFPAVALTRSPAWAGTAYLARYDGAAWTVAAIAPGRGTCALALDPGGSPVLAGQSNAWMSGRPWVARWDGTGWIVQTVDTLHDGSKVELGIDPQGGTHLAFSDAARGILRYGFNDRTLTLHRGAVWSLAPGWQANALPLDDSNDDETGGFPVPPNPASWALDDPAPAAPLVLYRALEAAGASPGNVLSAVKRGAGVRLVY